MLFRSILPKSLKGQFNLALAGLVFLIVVSQILAIYALGNLATTTQVLSEVRLTRMEQGQQVVNIAANIEKDAVLLQQDTHFRAVQDRYNRILELLSELDARVTALAQAGIEVSIIELQKTAQLFKGTVHVLVKLQEQKLNIDGNREKNQAASTRLERFNQSLLEQSRRLMAASETLSNDFSRAYRQDVEALSVDVQDNRLHLLGLLFASLIVAWLISFVFLSRVVVSRLQKVSAYLRTKQNLDSRTEKIPVSGFDEIGQMARSVEQYMQVNHDLVRARQEAAHSARFVAVGQLAAGIAHEINTPAQYIGDNLRFIQNISQGMAKDPACKVWHEDIEEAQTAVAESLDGIQHISSIVVSMKEFSHPGVSEYLDADIHNALNNALTVSQSEWKHVAVIEKDFDPQLPTVRCDLAKINQVFLNLIVNAAQALEEISQPETGKIIVRTRLKDDQVEISISDNGPGIAPEIAERIFDPFFTTKAPGKGTGQGLALCHDIVVNKHHGTIEVKGNLGEGAEFIVNLPVCDSVKRH